VTPRPDLLIRLVAESARETERRRQSTSGARVEERARRYAPKDFAAALRGPGLAVIAEMKRKTPSMGMLAADYRPEVIVADYVNGGAAAVSVLTQEASFGGELEHVAAVRARTELPILRKDFITDPYQVVEARAAGADAVLLIVAALGLHSLEQLLGLASEHGLAAVVEVHDEDETATALEGGAQIIGINHRDLRTFEVDIGLTERLRPHIPRDRIVVAESGIHGAADAKRMREAGADAILVGELLMRSTEPAACIQELASA
jgi:indole-3-glycerol phosphate synthase